MKQFVWLRGNIALLMFLGFYTVFPQAPVSAQTHPLNQYELQRVRPQDRVEIIRRKIMEVCPFCYTTSSGSTVTVSYGDGGGGSQNNSREIEERDNYSAERVVEYCEQLVDYYGDEDDIIIKDNYEDVVLAICFDD